MRESLVRDRTKTANQMHGFLLEFGISLPTGLAIMKRLADVLAEHELPVRLTVLLQRLHDHFVYLDEQIKGLDKELASQLADDDLGCRLLSLPCVGPITASLLAVEMGDGRQYKCSRNFAAFVGLEPRQYSTGGRANLLGISKRGDKNLRRLLDCWSSAPGSTYRDWSNKKGFWLTGCARCLDGDTRTWWPVPWRTSWRVLLGR